MRDLDRFVPIGECSDVVSSRDYVVRIYHDGRLSEDSFEILKAGQRVYAWRGNRFYLGGFSERNGRHDPPLRPDLIGNGEPCLVIGEWTGGAHSDYILHIFEIGERFHPLAVINGMHSDPMLEDRDKDGVPEIVMGDGTFAYWLTCFAYSPMPEVLLRWKDGAYRLAGDLMRKPPPPETELAAWAEGMRTGPGWNEELRIPPPALWGRMLDLIYSGNDAQARRLLRLAWRPALPGLEAFERDFRAQLATSPYWPEIRALQSR